MSACKSCGREPENGQATHWLGCEALFPVAGPPEEPGSACEHEGCEEPKASKSPRAKWCEVHKDPKNREN